MISYRCKGPAGGVYSAAEAARMGRPGLAGHIKRVGCGQALDGLIEGVPSDGKRHEVECPRCGNKSVISRLPAEA